MRVRLVQTLDGEREAIDVLESLAHRNAREMSRAKLPRLYGGAIRYATGRRHRALWKSASQVARVGHGDCADLAAYRVAELRRGGERGAGFLIRSGGRPGLYHVVVKRASGEIEDPSKRLGMRGTG